jgi:uridine phosphorylase
MSAQKMTIKKIRFPTDRYAVRRTNSFAITSTDVIHEAKALGVRKKQSAVPEIVVLTFSNWIVKTLTKVCTLRSWEWPFGKYSPYYTVFQSWKGSIHNKEIAVFIPPMSASPIMVFGEDLISNGAKIIFLLCASWSLGNKYLKKGQIHLPTYAQGLNGTTFHYGDRHFKAEAEARGLRALSGALESVKADWKSGGVGSCEAFYRISLKMINGFRKQGCLSMENGEVAALFMLAKIYDVCIGVLLQPYINLEKGWSSSYMDKKYRKTCHLQALAALRAISMLKKGEQE